MQLLTQSTTKSTATTTTGCASTANSNNSAINTNANHQTKSTGKMDKFYPPRPKINAFNELFKCQLCQGYLINPTTIDACTHTYCRSCIVRHLSEDEFCPQCKGNGGKTLSPANLKSDNVLRSIIYKLVPGLYQKERERIVQFVNNTKNEAPQPLGGSPPEPLSSLLESDDDFITARDSISLSLEFHPFLASQCDEADVPPVRYLKCPASLKIAHLKRFLCSKFDIDPCNRRVDIEIIYEDEVLPSDFTLMDVAYCYQYKGQSPLKLFYRILLFNDEQLAKPEHKEASVEKVSPEPSTTNLELRADSGLETKKALQNSSSLAKAAADARTKSSSSSPFITPSAPTSIGSSSNSSKVKSHKSSASKPVATPPSVKMTLSSRPAESKKSVSKKSSLAEDFTLPTTTTNDFKSLRSNDIRYSHYAVTASTTAPPTPAAATTTVTTGSKVKVKAPKEEKHASSKCDIVVSIPHNQMQDEWDSKPLSQLKTASKKSPNTPPAALSYSTVVEETKPTDANKKVRNVPKLKIELNSLKTKLIEKPKSADIRLDTLMIRHPHKPRKFSLDEPQAIANDKVDLQTYVKNIGLKPIEVQTNTSTPTTPHTPLETELSEKFTPNASPRSSCSSSTTSSSNGYLHVTGEISKSSSSSSSHKKRKKKHSKEPRDSKRKKMHAEISSHAADESLKMKVKLTTPLSIKPSKLESKKSPPSSDKTEGFFFAKPPKSPETKIKLAFEPLPPSKETQEKPKEKLKTPSDKKAKDALKLQPLAIKTCKDFEDDDDISMLPDITTSLSLSKPLTNLKDSKLPHSPPLPPSLFKTTPLTFSTFTPNVVTAPKSKSVVTPAKPAKDPKPVQPIRMKTLAPKPMPASKPLAVPIKPPQFAVPNLPKLMASNSSKFLNSTPSSIASSASKQMGNLLKRSASMDEGKSMAKHPKLDKPHQITVSAYGSNLQVTRVEVPATPTSSTAKATYEIPLYSPLSASYNPKCTFSVGSSSAGGRTQTGALTSASPTAVAKAPMFTTSMATKKPEKDKAKAKSSPSGLSYGSSKTSPVMGPPLSLGKLNTVVPMSVKSPPVPTLSANKALSPSLGMVNSRPGLSACQVTEKKTDATISSSLKASNNGPLEKPNSSSLRQFRLPSRESAQDILDLSAAPKSANGLPAAEKKSPAATTAGSSLELALTKIKQNISNNNNNNNHQESKPSQLDLKPNSDDLQNLHLLSESATAREKIAINSPTSSVPCSLYDKAKINQNSLVRQQNASVRSIPNPSALAFRNHQPANTIPMVTIAAPLVSALTNADADKSLLSKPLSPLSAMPQSPNFTTSSRNTSSATSLTTKRHPSIDQVAASLNIRATAAAAAEAATAKSSLKQLDEMAIVTSTSSLAETNGGSKLKQIKQETVEQTPTAAANSSSHCQQPSSTVHSAMATSSEVVEIKKEPEDRFSDSSAMADEPRDQVNTLFAAAKSSSSSGSGSTGAATTAMPVPSSLVSKVENLVTSVINVSTPTSSLLTTSSAGF